MLLVWHVLNLIGFCLPIALSQAISSVESQKGAITIQWSTINTYIHLSILCYSLNSSQIELNYFTECLPYTAHPSRVRHVTTRTPSSFPLLASHERVVFQTFSALFLFFEFLEALPRRPTYPFQKNYCRNLILNVLIFAVCFRGRRNLRFVPILFVSKFRVFTSTHPPARSFLLPRFPPAGSAEPTAQYAHALLAAYSF